MTTSTTTKPRRGLGPSPLSHARSLPVVANAQAASDAAIPTLPPAEQPPAVQAAKPPKPSAKASAPTSEPRPEPGQGATRTLVRKRDKETLVRKNLRLKQPIAEALEAYCRQERWPESTIVERALAMYLQAESPEHLKALADG